MEHAENLLADLDRLVRDGERTMRHLLTAMDGLGEISGEGESRSGRVSARVDAGGLLDTVTISVRGMRLDAEELADEVVQAVRAAQADHERRGRELLPPGEEIALRDFQRTLEDLQDSYARESAERVGDLTRMSWAQPDSPRTHE